MIALDVIHLQTAADARNPSDRDRTHQLAVADFSLNAPATLKYHSVELY